MADGATTFFIGHRGVGKTSFLRRAEALFGFLECKGRFVDLDGEIESRQNRSVSDIFELEGEEAFRKIEIETLNLVLEDARAGDSRRLFVSLGAGFRGELPAPSRVIWLRRPTDSDGRVFLTRPRLREQISPLSEYKERFLERQDRYRRLATDCLVLPEGWQDSSLDENSPEGFFLGSKKARIGGFLTLLPRRGAGIEWSRFLNRRLHWGVARLELRDDLLDDEEIETLTALIPPERTLVSFRRMRQGLSGSFERHLKEDGILWDWPLELDGSPPAEPPIVSAHHRGSDESVRDVAARIVREATTGAWLKLACEIHTLAELWEGHAWQQEDPDRRSFLPRSDCDECETRGLSGRWSWYRCLQKGKMPVNFFREDEGSAPDQPSLIEWTSTPSKTTGFAAVLGDPVRHSRTPMEHRDFFRTLTMPVFAIQLPLDELHETELDLLAQFGMRFAAVTSPLKTRAYELCDEHWEEAEGLKSVNTIQRSPTGWVGTNTDVVGLRAWLTESLESLDSFSPAVSDGGRVVIVWGGGGTRASLKSVLPDASFYSARTGEVLADWGLSHSTPPDVVIWAVGRSRQSSCVWPPDHWRPEAVLDLNYAEDSPGREFAQRLGCRYESGLSMFRAQAAAQRVFWSSENEESIKGSSAR